MNHWINELTENPAGITFKDRRNWDKKSRLLSSIDKARRILDYHPRTDFKEGLGHTYNWFTENWSNIKKSAEFQPSNYIGQTNHHLLMALGIILGTRPEIIKMTPHNTPMRGKIRPLLPTPHWPALQPRTGPSLLQRPEATRTQL